MITKTVFVIVDIIAIIDILFTIRAAMRIKAEYGRWLEYTLIASVVAILANIAVACSVSALFAKTAYCLYFSSIDWILYFLTGFCLRYTDHVDQLKKLRVVSAGIMALDSLSIFANLIFGHQFDIYETVTSSGAVFYQTSFHPSYYIHLAIDYITILIALFFIVHKIASSYDLYRAKYVIILSVLLFVILLNLAYMALSLVLDASVVFYAVAGTLIYFCAEIFVPKRLINSSVIRAVDDMNEGLILFDINNRCIYANAFCSYRFDVNEPVSYVMDELKKAGKRFGEVPYSRTDGLINESFKIKYTSLLDRHARAIGSYFLIQDTSEETRYMEEVEEARIAADNANNAKSAFLANMSHEIRTPLNSVLGMNEMILRTADDPEIREYAENIKNSGNTLLNLINEILDFSKIEAGRMNIITGDYDLQQVIRDCYYFFEEPAGSKDLYLHIRYDEKLPARLKGDAFHIKQILTNMISNAVKYTKAGGVTVDISKKHIGSSRIELIFEISDTGIGISKEDVPFLFESFKRVNERENATIQGTGLGLAITRQLVEMMEGEITVDSVPGAGSTFRISIPQEIADPSPSGPLLLRHKDDEEVYRESFRAPDARILIVDDVPLNLKVAVALLKNTQLRIETAGSGGEAIDMCRHGKYNAILLDHRMPGKDGVETFKEIKETRLNHDTPVIMLTANALGDAEEEYKKEGFAGYLSKPIDIRAMEKLLTDVLPSELVILSR